jgi:4'-phosphopantetheinyl transferase
MPLLLSKQIHDQAAYAVWNIQETFLEIPYLAPEPFPADLHPVRQAEWIIGRILIQRLCNIFGLEYQGVGRRDTGKPFLIGHNFDISISHSFPIAAAMLHLKSPCGIDMERPRQKMIATQYKYLHPSEHQYANDMEKLCTIWCGKEVVYKIHGRKYLSLKDEIKITIESKDTLIGEILRPGEETRHIIHYEWVKDYLLGYNE